MTASRRYAPVLAGVAIAVALAIGPLAPGPGLAAQGADEPRVQIEVLREAGRTVGDPIRIIVTVEHSLAGRVIVPGAPAPLGDLEPAVAVVERREADGRATTTIRYTTRAFVSGQLNWQLPPLTYESPDGQRTIDSTPQSLEVASVLPADLNGVTPRPLKPAETLGGGGAQPAVLGGMGGGIALALALLILALRRRRPRPVPPAVAPPDPVLAADAALIAIGAAGLLPGAVDQYCARINEALRAFLRARYRIPAHNLTTRELPERLAAVDAPAATVQMVTSLYAQTDAAIYAGTTLSAIRAQRLLDLARAIIQPPTVAPAPTDAGWARPRSGPNGAP